MLEATNAGGGVYTFGLAPDSAWVLGGQLAFALMVETVDSLGSSEVLRRIPFWGSDVPLYAAQGFAFVPIETVIVGVAPQSPSGPPA